jgi:hypothetical protein
VPRVSESERRLLAGEFVGLHFVLRDLRAEEEADAIRLEAFEWMMRQTWSPPDVEDP